MKAPKTICAAMVLAAMMVSCTREAEHNDAISTERELVFTAGWTDGSEEDSRTVLQAMLLS
ncbi:MAG: hypothetical protein IJQ93_10690 [Bacteroidales bacterium]|nr:hypothetical protein [Bacteroidales bacterium]